MKVICKFIFCKLLKIHRYKNEINSNMISEGVDEFKRCVFCGNTIIKYM